MSKAIIEKLQRDGRRSYAGIGQDVGLSEAAVRQRVQRLIDAGVMDIVAVTDPMQLGFSRQAMVGIRCQGDTTKVAERLAKIDAVSYVVLTAGHCIHNSTRGGYVTSARFYPGQYQANLGDTVQRPYGSKADVAALQTTDTWTQISGSDSYPVTDYTSDMAAIEFKTPFTFTDTFMPTKPVAPESTAPIRKPTAEVSPRK